jgi:hypothetical protein
MHLYTLQIKLQILVLAACWPVVFVKSDDCAPDYCEIAECAQAFGCNPDEFMMPNATLCGCCDACVRQLGITIITIIMDVFITKTISLNDLWCCALWLTIVLF